MVSIRLAWGRFAKKYLCVMFSVIQKLLILFSSLFETGEGMFANKTKCIIANLIAHIVFIVFANWLY